MGELSTLPNIGKKLEMQLNQVGIMTVDQFKEIGSKEAWLRILSMDRSACILRLSALEGAIQGIRRNDLDQKTKNELKAFYHEHK